MTTDIRATLTQLAIESIGRSELPDGDLAESLDSMERLSLVVAIEDHFEIAFDEDDEAVAVTLDDVVRLIEGKLARG